ncbi:MAG TPA: pirin family protein [Chlamydiales bacterium]
MITVRKSEERGQADHGWLQTQHTFSFADYYDLAHMNFRSLRVINEDVVAPKKGFGAHPHKDMEILTYILEGTLEHKDNMGNTSQMKAGEFQLMSAGLGVKHSEYNPSSKEKVHLLQIWILPKEKGITPNYQQKSFASHKDGFQLVVSPDGAEGSLRIHQDAKVYLGRFEAERKAMVPIAINRYAWIQVTRGEVSVDGIFLKSGDGAHFLLAKEAISVEPKTKAEILLFDLG